MSKYLPIDLFTRQALLYPLDSPFLPPENKVSKDHSYAAGRLTGSLVGGLPKTGQTTKYANGDDGDLRKGFTKSYTDHGNGTVTDNVTGLMWEQKSSTPGAINFNEDVYYWEHESEDTVFDYIAALNAANYGGHDDWRLPNIYEFFSISLLENAIGYPYIDMTAFPNTRTGNYWSSTTSPFYTANAMREDFYHGHPGHSVKSANSFYVRAVRGGV